MRKGRPSAGLFRVISSILELMPRRYCPRINGFRTGARPAASPAEMRQSHPDRNFRARRTIFCSGTGYHRLRARTAKAPGAMQTGPMGVCPAAFLPIHPSPFGRAANTTMKPRLREPYGAPHACGARPLASPRYPRFSGARPCKTGDPPPRLTPPRARHRAVAGLHRGPVVAASQLEGGHHDHR